MDKLKRENKQLREGLDNKELRIVDIKNRTIEDLEDKIKQDKQENEQLIKNLLNE